MMPLSGQEDDGINTLSVHSGVKNPFFYIGQSLYHHYTKCGFRFKEEKSKLKQRPPIYYYEIVKKELLSAEAAQVRLL